MLYLLIVEKVITDTVYESVLVFTASATSKVAKRWQLHIATHLRHLILLGSSDSSHVFIALKHPQL